MGQSSIFYWAAVLRQFVFIRSRNVAGTVTFDSVAIITTDGRKIAISELGPAEEMREVIMRGRGR